MTGASLPHVSVPGFAKAVEAVPPPNSVTLYFCPVCGRQKPPMWPAQAEDCYGEWWSNTPRRDTGRTSDHDLTPFVAVVYERRFVPVADEEGSDG